MFIVWGFRERLKKSFYMGIRYCQHCNEFQHVYGMRIVGQFTIFFIPVFWWGKEYFWGCKACNYGKKLNKKEYSEMAEKYLGFLKEEETNDIFEFCCGLARGRENTEENVQKLLEMVQERFDLKGFDDDFQVMIKNILILEEYKANQPQIVQ